MQHPPRRAEEPPISKVGAKAREQLLEAAGEIFAEKGFQGATSREICQLAGVNSASVNYHFGGLEALYIATLKEAHRRANFISPAELGATPAAPRERLRVLLRDMVARLSQSINKSWEMRLVSREMVIPTFAQADFVATEIEPRRAYLKSLIADIIDRSPEDPLVGRCLLTVIAPFIMLSVISRSSFDAMLPDIAGRGEGIDALAIHVERFVLGGLDAVR